MAGYRVQEVLIGQNATAVGRTSKIWGSMTIASSTVTKATFTVDMASVVSDQSERNAHFDGSIMDVSQYPTATLTLSSPIDLGTIPAEGAVAHYTAVGDLDMHGVTKSVSFPVTAERVGSGIDVLADIPITFSEWNIANPSIGGFVTTANSGTLEVLLQLTQGAGQPGLEVVRFGGPGRWRRPCDRAQHHCSALAASRPADSHHPAPPNATRIVFLAPDRPGWRSTTRSRFIGCYVTAGSGYGLRVITLPHPGKDP